MCAFYGIRIMRVEGAGMHGAAKQRGAAGEGGRGTEGKEAAGRRTPISSVFAHEWRYLKTLKGLLVQFFALAVCPAAFI